MSNKSTYALYFGNRGFFPESLIAGARKELSEKLAALGHETIMLDETATRHGAVETPAEGKIYAKFLEQNKGKFQGVILCLPNFGDETGAVEAMKDAGVPIFIHAYPDEIDKMDIASRRDAFCGKFSVMDVFTQYGIPFTALKPHTVHPSDAKFTENIATFDAVCKIVNGMKRMTVGALGARTTAFKTVRFDELTLQKYGITVEALDLSELIFRTEQLDTSTEAYKNKAETLRNYTNWGGVPEQSFINLTKLGVVIDEIIAEYEMDAIALRCWIELEKTLKISPCVLLSELNDRGIPAACELDVCNAVPMYAMKLATGKSPACLDWNNNYGDDENKCILFHCGPVAQSLMTAKGQVIDHPMFAKALGAGCGFGCNVGRIAPNPFTFASSVTFDGKLKFYLGEGEFTADKIPDEFFGCAGVAHIDDLQEKLNKIGYAGYRHHVAVAPGLVEAAMREAFIRYLNYEIMDI
jgi:L-fucose isomerase-like protein